MKIKKLATISVGILFLSISLYFFSACNTSSANGQFEKIKNSNSIALLDSFIYAFPDSENFDEALALRNKLVFDSISKINTAQEYRKYVRQFPNAQEAEIAKQKIEQLKDVQAVISTFRGNAQRNFYGNSCPSKLDEIWTLNLGAGKSYAYGKMYVWTGAGWTGQPLIVIEDTVTYIVQGSFDYHVRKIDASNGKVLWKYKFDDIIKGTGTIWVNSKAENKEEKVIIMQGSRRGEGTNTNLALSFRGISYFTGKELWKLNSRKTPSYSRDVDGSAITIGDTAYIGLENGIFTVFDPNVKKAETREGILQPKIYNEVELWVEKDKQVAGGNLVTESSGTLLNGRIYNSTGAGHVFGYNLKTKKIDWDYYIGADLDGSAPVTDDSCLLVTVEKEYIKGNGGVFKLDPSKSPENAAVWYFPVQNRKFAFWEGGIIGSAAVNDMYVNNNQTHIAAFIAIDGNLYVVDHQNLSNEKVAGPDGITQYPTPKLLFKYNVGASISSPIIVNNRIVACTYDGIYLFGFDEKMNFKLLAQKKGISFEASPICWDNKIYVVSNTTGLMYCLGEK